MKKITGFDPMGDRYAFDFKMCHYKKGWAQLDTRQDASYYGNWINPITRQLVSYCEGDITHTQCDDDAEFAHELLTTLNWHAERDYNPKIDGMCEPAIIAAFTNLGFAEWLH